MIIDEKQIRMYFLKYRPQTIAELDLEDIRQQLSRILAQKEIPQTLLFAGPKGAGKTSAARILAKAVNCPQPQGIEPCNHCSLCLEITRGASLDVLEIDAASHRGIDDIRQLRERVGLAPTKGKYKIYIIDEVHMLTKEAFNALLKTLEEPPAHVIFVLCTTNPEKIIPTVLSRLIRIDFRRGRPDEIRRSLTKVIKGEKLVIDAKVIKTIIDLANGSFRDGQKILEKLVLALGKKIDWSEAEGILGRWQTRRPLALLSFLAQGEIKPALAAVEELTQEGVDFVDYLRQLLELLRQLILIKTGVTKEDQELVELSRQYSLTDLTHLSRLFSQAVLESKASLLPQLPLQLAMINFLGNKIGNKKETVGQLEEKGGKTGIVQDKTQVSGKTKKDLGWIRDHWQTLLRVVKPLNHSVAAFLRAARPKQLVGDKLILEVFYPFHKEKLEEEKNKRIVEAGLSRVSGLSLKIQCVLAKKEPQEGEKARDQSNSGAKSYEEEELYRLAKEIFGS